MIHLAAMIVVGYAIWCFVAACINEHNKKKDMDEAVKYLTAYMIQRQQ